jgi:hypothetical protein
MLVCLFNVLYYCKNVDILTVSIFALVQNVLTSTATYLYLTHVRLPAEFKHISKRRKENLLGSL